MRRALLIGIDNYPSAPLTGCVADAERVAAVVARHGDGSPNFDCRVMTAPRGGGTLGRAALREAIERHLSYDAEEALMHFSGHGLINDLGGFLVTSDGERGDEGIAMQHIMQLVQKSPIPEITIMLDCCHSGAFGELDVGPSATVRLREGVSILTASSTREVSLEVDGGGIFTSLVCEALAGQAANLFGHITVPGIYAHVESQLGAWDQRPQFRTNLRAMTPLRRVEPRVRLETLRRLPMLFESARAAYPLTPAHEPSTEPSDPKLEAAFADLQSLCRQGLVEPVGEEHMYYAAINSKACRLTLAGQHVWQLAKKGKI